MGNLVVCLVVGFVGYYLLLVVVVGHWLWLLNFVCYSCWLYLVKVAKFCWYELQIWLTNRRHQKGGWPGSLFGYDCIMC